MGLKRHPIKYIRDGIKWRYPNRESSCFVCGKTEELQLHHLYSIAWMYNTWSKRHQIVTEEDAIRLREEFYVDFEDYLLNFVYTLCKEHHDKLHKAFGADPPPTTVAKQRSWLETRRNTFGS